MLNKFQSKEEDQEWHYCQHNADDDLPGEYDKILRGHGVLFNEVW